MTPVARTVSGPLTGDVSGQDFTSSLDTDGTLTVFATHGSVTKNPDLSTYTLGANVTLTPVPDAGYNFASWSGDVPVGHSTDNPLLVMMDRDRTITANFTEPGVVAADYFDRPNETPLTVGGNWQRFSSGGLVNLAGNEVAGGSGDALYYWQGPGTFSNTAQFSRVKVTNAGGQVGLVLLGTSSQALVASWTGGTLFIYWYSGGTYQGNLATAASALLAGDVIEAALQGGVIYVRRNGAVLASVAKPTALTSGRPGFETFQAGAKLDDWESGTPASYTISGTITEASMGLSGVLVTASGGFSGNATTNGNGAYAIAGVPSGATSILLTPTLSGHIMNPTTRTVLDPVTGNLTGQDFTSTLDTDFALSVTVTHGSVTKTPDLPTYPMGTIVTLTLVPDPGYILASWSGDVPAGHQTENPLIVTMDRDRTITANFMGPGVVAADSFDRPNETPLLVGGSWQRVLTTGTANLTSNRVVGGSGDALYFWQGSGTFDATKQFARLRVANAAGQVGLVLLGASDQALVVSWSGGTVFIYWYSAGSYQGSLTTASSTIVNGDVIEAAIENGTIYAKRNGALVTSVANTTTLSSGKPGFETFSTGGIIDDWEAGPAPCEIEVCDNRDNDCDGSIDEGDPGGGATCVTALPGVCSAGTAHCARGTVVCQPNIAPSPETCNGLDDDCDGVVDEGVPPPSEVEGVRVEQRHPTKVSWTSVSAMAYDIASGTVSSLRANGTTAASCLSDDRTSASMVDNRAEPAAGGGYYYLVRAESACGSGTFGSNSAGLRLLPQACP
jgi:hypothetical protein